MSVVLVYLAAIIFVIVLFKIAVVVPEQECYIIERL
jgi:regulator of protease activity HflC (stomatin/prohibitin superfamily)